MLHSPEAAARFAQTPGGRAEEVAKAIDLGPSMSQFAAGRLLDPICPAFQRKDQSSLWPLTTSSAPLQTRSSLGGTQHRARIVSSQLIKVKGFSPDSPPEEGTFSDSTTRSSTSSWKPALVKTRSASDSPGRGGRSRRLEGHVKKCRIC
jgi:hypothetical protein